MGATSRTREEIGKIAASFPLSAVALLRNKDEDAAPINWAPDAASEGDSEWESQEWAKLIGAWRAPEDVHDFSYRIKRVTKGQEVIEYYNSMGRS